MEMTDLEPLTVQKENIVEMPLGLLGFEHIKKFVLLANAEEEPFKWLQVLDDASLAFLAISPFEIFPDYVPDISDQDVEFLGLTSSADALVLNIVTQRGNREATVNLKGPIVVNRYTLRAKQVVISNAADYSSQQPLPLAEA